MPSSVNELKVPCKGFGEIKFIDYALYHGKQFHINFNTSKEELEALIFLDSRGISEKYENSLAKKITNNMINSKKKFLIICRPLELTTWATLVNFMVTNNIKPVEIITNMGFVDFTPKKRIVLERSIRQIEYFMGSNIAYPIFTEKYLSNRNEYIDLYTTRYNHQYKEAIEEVVANKARLVIINTPLTTKQIRIERERPISFFDGQKNANMFNNSIKGAESIDFPMIDERYTYDAVHYTDEGNELIYDRVKRVL